MAKVNICDVEVLNNPATFFDKFKFRVTFECHEPLDEDLEWKLVYVGSAYNSSLDQTLDSILVGPIPVGRHQFIFEVDPPDPKKIPSEDLVGVTVVLIQALYREKEFIRVGYYVNNEYIKEELRNEPPPEPLLNELERNIIVTDPRVTRFPIDWGDGLLDGCQEPDQKSDEEEEEEEEEDEDVEENKEMTINSNDDEGSDHENSNELFAEKETLQEHDENVDVKGITKSSNATEKLNNEIACPGQRATSPFHQLQTSTGESNV